jgi:hypothetical protein
MLGSSQRWGCTSVELGGVLPICDAGWSSYNLHMTTITNDQLIPSTDSNRPNRSLRHAVGGFLAGAVLASAAFVGVNVLTDSSSASKAPAVQQVNAPATPKSVIDYHTSAARDGLAKEFAPNRFGEVAPSASSASSDTAPTRIDSCHPGLPC